jgi:hypothetical protein
MSLITASMAIALASVIAPIAVADKSSGSNGLETADIKVHENTGGLSAQDFNFHVGTCQGGHTTSTLNEVTQGAGCSALKSPSEFHSPQH